MDYNKEFQRIILEQQLKRGLDIKKKLIETLKTTDNKEYLEFFLQATDFEGFLKNNDLNLENLKDDEQMKALIEEDSQLIKGLKKTAEERLQQLKEKEKGKDKDDKDKKERTEQDEENDEHTGREHNKEQNSSSIENDMDISKKMPQFKVIAVPVMQRYDSLSYMKYLVRQGTFFMEKIKENIDRCPSPMMLAYMSNNNDFYTRDQMLQRETQRMPFCDEELNMLCEQRIEAAQQVKDTVRQYIEQYRRQFEENQNKKDEEEKTFEDDEEKLQKQEKLSEDDKEQVDARNEKIEEDDRSEEVEQEQDNTPRKSWELSPQQKVEVQKGQQQVAQEYNEGQTNPQLENQQPNVENEMEL